MQVDDAVNPGGFVWGSQRTALKSRMMRRVPWVICLVICALSWRSATGQNGIDTSPVPDRPATATPTASSGLVWVNTRSKVYHYPGHRWYGGTQHGKYVSEAQAMAEGDRPAQNEHRPLDFGTAVMPAGVSSSPTPSEAPTTEQLVRSAPIVPAAVSSPATTFADATPTPGPIVASTTANQLSITASEQLSVCVQAIAAQSDPAKLATLGERGANPRLKRIMYYLAQARASGAVPGDVIEQAQRQNGSFGTPRALLVKASLLRNLKICDGLGLLTPGNLAGLRRGGAPTVTRGPYVGQKAEVDHIVPLARARGIGNELANLEMLPASLNRAKSDKVGERQLDLANKLHDAGLLSDADFARVQARFRPAGTEKYELPTP